MIEERLLICLRGRANARGIVPVRGDVLSKEVEADQADIGAALAKLERAGLVEILTPFPFLVVKLRKWSSTAAKVDGSASAAYSHSKLSNNRLIESYRPAKDGALLREILDTLGESDPTSFEGAIKNFPPEVIRKALDRVRRTRSLRKSRTALFRYLLTKLS